MRILANYGYKNNGDSYSVTFETVGDVQKERADSVVDELFAMAKAAIDRQVNHVADPLEFPPREEKGKVTIPQPTRPEYSRVKDSGKPVLKDPNAPASKKQKSLIIRLAKERGQFIENLNSLTMQEASQAIDDLMAVAA